MRTTTPRNLFLGMIATAFAAFAAGPLAGQDYGDQPPGGPPPDDIQQTVARISYVDGNDASYSRGDDPDDWQAAVVNVPVTLGDRVYTGNGARMELQVNGGALVRLAPQTDLTALNLTDDVKQLSLAAGTASFRLRRLHNDEVFEVDTPNAAVTFDTPGNFRIDVDGNGNARVVVRSGHATVSADGGEIPVTSGNEISIQGYDNPSYDVVRLGALDPWDRWVSTRDSRFRRIGSYQYVSADIVGGEDLDQYGRWDDVPQYGHAWTPASVAAGWTPYSNGQWMWQDPWGWTWVGAEPWGWAPYHYGRWVTYSSRWYWVPSGPQVAVAYSPAVVGFVGGGPGFSASFSVGGGGGYVGWFPLAPHDPFVPWWGAHRAPESRVTNVTNVTYVNQNYVTVVNQNTFVSGGSVARNMIRDPQIVRQVRSAPVVRGPLLVVPTTASLRVAPASPRAAPRPPAVVERRAVVTRVAAPPAPASFQTKERVIQQNHGAPIAPRAAAQLSIQSHDGARASAPVRPATAQQQGRVGLTPRRGDVEVKPQAITAPRGKALATADRPIAASPAADAKRGEAPMRIAPGAVSRSPEAPGAPPAARREEAPPAAAPPPPAGEAWRQRVPPGQQRQAAPPAREAPPSRSEAAPPPPESRAIPPGRSAEEERRSNAPRPERAAPPPQRPAEAVPPSPGEERRAVPPGHDRQVESAPPPPPRRSTPPERETPPPPPARHAAPPENGAAPPPSAEGKPAPRAQPPDRAKGNDKAQKAKDDKAQKEKEDKKKKEEPPPPPPSR